MTYEQIDVITIPSSFPFCMARVVVSLPVIVQFSAEKQNLYFSTQIGIIFEDDQVIGRPQFVSNMAAVICMDRQADKHTDLVIFTLTPNNS